MSTRTRNQTIVRCNSCGQVYHVPHSPDERRAKCSPCGNEFTIPAGVVAGEASGPNKSARNAAADRYAAAQMASSISQQVTLGGWSYRRKGAVAAGVLMLGLCAFVAFGVDRNPDAKSAVADPDIKPAGNLDRVAAANLSLPQNQHEYKSVTSLIEAVEPSVVQIETGSGYGSGFVLDKSGLIVTCHHCIKNSLYATVVFPDGRRLEVSGIAALAPECDVAILAVDPVNSLVPLVPLSLADAKPKKGERIIAIGSPAGLSFSESEGSVSSMRTVEELSKISSDFRIPSLALVPTTSLVQVTATAMPGNSGGPVVDYRGNVIGISAFALNWRDGHTYDFCIAASEIRRVFAARTGKIRPLWTSEVAEPPVTQFLEEKEQH